MSKQLSLRNSIFTVIIAIAVLSLCALLVSAHLFRNYVTEQERIAVDDLVQVKVLDLHNELSRYSTELGLGLQSEPSFRQAFKVHDEKLITQYLNDHFHQYYVTAGVIDLKKIFLLDKDYNYLHHSTDGLISTNSTNPICRNVTERAKQRQGADLLKPISGLCIFNGKAYYSVIVPVGTLSPEGYLQVITNPIFNIIALSTAINSPIKVIQPDGTIEYTSINWPVESEQDNYLTIVHDVHGDDVGVIYKIEVAKNMVLLHQGFDSTTYTVIIVFVLFMGVGLIISGLISRKSLTALKQISYGVIETGLGHYENIPKSGYTELDTVIDAYNMMTEKVKDHQLKLESEITIATEQLRTALDTVERRNKELETAIEMADQANTTKSVFLANMSHELRTPLNAIIGYSEIVMEDLVDIGEAGLNHDIEKINSAGKHLLEIVNNILDLSKIEAGKIELDLTQFNLMDTIKASIETVLPMANKKHLQLKCNCNLDESAIYSDEIRIKQVLINLLNNAVKFTDKGEINVALKSEHYLDKPVYIVDVIDTGIGIKAEDIGHLFQAFHQVDESTTRRYDGTGLGLALCKQLIEGLGGAITVTSTYRSGSRFSVRIPVDLHH